MTSRSKQEGSEPTDDEQGETSDRETTAADPSPAASSRPTPAEVGFNQEIADWHAELNGEAPIDWANMPPVETWDTETVIKRLPRVVE